MTYRIDSAISTHPGRIRKINEDAVFSFVLPKDKGEGMGLLIVADGVGGHKAGDIASKLAIDTIFENLNYFLNANRIDDTRPMDPVNVNDLMEKDNPDYLEKRLELAVERANKIIFQYAQGHPEKAGNLGTTVTCALIRDNKIVIANVGDSRTYRWRNGKLTQLTEDHSLVGQLVRDGQLPYDAYYTHPRRNIITRALGQSPSIEVDLQTVLIEEGDIILLCSDGLWEMIRDDKIEQVLKKMKSLNTAVDELVGYANDQGGADNISVVIGKIESAK